MNQTLTKPFCQSLYFQLPSLKLAAQAFGDPQKPLCLMLHGWLENAASFHKIAPLLTQLNYYVVAIDLPGHGHSEHRNTQSRYDFLDWVNDLWQLLHTIGQYKLSKQPMLLIGHSMGGAIATLLSSILPQRIQHLVLLDNFGPRATDSQTLPKQLPLHFRQQQHKAQKPLSTYKNKQQMTQLLHHLVSKLPLEDAAALVERGSRPHEGGWTWNYDQRLKDTSVITPRENDITACMMQICCPVLLIQPNDGLPEVNLHLKQRRHCIKNLHIQSHPGGHHIHMTQSPWVYECIESFIKTNHCLKRC